MLSLTLSPSTIVQTRDWRRRNQRTRVSQLLNLRSELMLILTRRIGETLNIGDHREEIYERIKAE